ncbi:hypothetical protein G6F31_015733 [Rhizopus arrhizus]|nr:hypothetical protein G6F31_015733 [Rhizopus arrhizus]
MADKPKQMLLDPGFELTLRPMRYPQFYDMYRNAIKNTWTVEEINFQIDITDLHSKMSPGERHLIHRLVAFFATGDSIVSNNLVLNLSAARAVLPDPARQLPAGPGRARQSLRRGGEHRLDQEEGRFLLQVDRFDPGPDAHRDPRRAPPVPAQPELLRCVHRRPVLLRRLRLRVLLPFARPAAGPGVGHQLGVPRRERAHGIRVRVGARGARGGAGPVRR